MQTISYKLRTLACIWLVFGIIQSITVSFFIYFGSSMLQISNDASKKSSSIIGFGVAYIVLATLLLIVALINIGFAVLHDLFSTKLSKQPIKIAEKFLTNKCLFNDCGNIAYHFAFCMG